MVQLFGAILGQDFNCHLEQTTRCNVMCNKLLQCMVQLFGAILGQDLNGHLVRAKAKDRDRVVSV